MKIIMCPDCGNRMEYIQVESTYFCRHCGNRAYFLPSAIDEGYPRNAQIAKEIHAKLGRDEVVTGD